jgi:hypothetical protein
MDRVLVSDQASEAEGVEDAEMRCIHHRNSSRHVDPPTGIYYFPHGCACFSDKYQLLCDQHAYKARGIEGMEFCGLVHGIGERRELEMAEDRRLERLSVTIKDFEPALAAEELHGVFRD